MLQKMLRKALIFGNAGSGKSTLAKSLCNVEGLSLLDLDTLAWEATDPPERKPLDESYRVIRSFVDSSDGWVIEGCYADLIEQVLSYATEVIFMNLPIEICISNAKKRPWESHKYESKEAQDANLEMLIDWISQYNQRTDACSEQSHRSLYEKFQGEKLMYVSNERNV